MSGNLLLQLVAGWCPARRAHRAPVPVTANAAAVRSNDDSTVPSRETACRPLSLYRAVKLR